MKRPLIKAKFLIAKIRLQLILQLLELTFFRDLIPALRPHLLDSIKDFKTRSFRDLAI